MWLRSVFAAARAQGTGRFRLASTQGEHFEIHLREGRPVSLRGSATAVPKVGTLIAAGRTPSQLSDAAERNLVSVNKSSDGHPIGAWMLLSGLCSREELCAALRTQMSMLFETMFAQQSLEGEFHVGGVRETPEFEPETLASLCMRTARRMHLQAEGWSNVPLTLSFVGRQLLESFALAPAERACLELCRRKPVSKEQLQSVLGDAPMVHEAISSLFWLGAFERARRGHGSYLSLLQERRRARMPFAPSSITAEERRRRIGAAHPDRFASDSSMAVKHASEEALRCLLRKR